MKQVYILHHVHVFEEDNEDVKIIGIYASEALAMQAIKRTKKLEGFRDVPDGFEISKYVLDTDHWAEGYVTVS